MATREEFGKYLLLKKLSEDPLGETFRAGRIGDSGVEQVTLLRALNGPRVDAAPLAGELTGRTAIQQGLKSPNIGSGVDAGEVRGVPYIAYDYISGKNLAILLRQVESQNSPMAPDHALLIAERTALALAVAFESRYEGERVRHGFLVPHLVMISNEGETRVLGFEAGPLLAEQARGGTFEPEISAYLAPELLAGEEPSKADDVYSLGALLFELLTGHRPATDPSAMAEQIDRATVAADGQPLPAPIATLLKKSLVARDQRMPEPVTWHKALSKIMMEGEWSATTFNLAFFMHNLFKREIERESEELEAEKRISVTSTAQTQAIPAETAQEARQAARPTPPEPDEETSDTAAVRRQYGAPEEGGKKRLLWAGVAAVVVAAAVGGYVLWQGLPGGGEQPAEGPETAQTEPAPPELPPPPPEPEPEGETDGEGQAQEPEGEIPESSPDQLQKEMEAMIEARSRDVEAKLKAQYDERIRELQQQLEASQQQAQRREESTEPPPPEPTPQPAREEPAEPAAPEGASAEEATPAAELETEPTREEPAEPAPPTREQEAEPPTSTPPSQPTQPEPAPPEPDRIEPPELVERPQPRYPPIARRVGKEATIVLRVLVDERGRVTEVEQLGGKVGFGLDQAAREAAKGVEYRPGRRNGRPVEMWTTLRVSFKP